MRSSASVFECFGEELLVRVAESETLIELEHNFSDTLWAQLPTFPRVAPAAPEGVREPEVESR